MNLIVTPMTCGGCVRSVTRALQAVDPQARVSVDLPSQRVDVDGTLSTEAAIAALVAAGYQAVPASPREAAA